MVQVPPLPVELAHRAAAAVPAPSPSPTRPPRPGWARARGEPIAATASSGGSQPTDEHVGPERGGAGKEHNPRAQRHRAGSGSTRVTPNTRNAAAIAMPAAA